MLTKDIIAILTEEIIKKNEEFDYRDKFDRIKEALLRISLEVEKNKIELEGMLSQKIVYQLKN